MFQHQSIPTVSKIVRALVALFLLMQIVSYTLLLMFSNNVGGTTFELSEHFYFFTSAVNIDFSGSWEDLAQALSDEGFNTLLILGSADLLPSILLYLSLFKLFARGQARPRLRGAAALDGRQPAQTPHYRR